MDFEIDDDEDFGPKVPAGSTERQNVPAGTHDFTIKKLAYDAPAGKLDIWLAGHADYGWVFASLYAKSKFAKPIAKTLLAALGMTKEQWRDAVPADFLGQPIRARVYHKEKDGKTYVNVAEFFPPADDAGHPPADMPTFAKADPVAVPASDDIPF
jgi:hypothetical protein